MSKPTKLGYYNRRHRRARAAYSKFMDFWEDTPEHWITLESVCAKYRRFASSHNERYGEFYLRGRVPVASKTALVYPQSEWQNPPSVYEE